MNYLQKNLEAIAKNNRELADRIVKAESTGEYQLITARNGDMTLKAGNILLHSSYNPAREAERLAEKINIPPGWMLVKGFGLGYLPEALKQRGFRPVIVEADINILRIACENRDLSGLLENVLVFAGQSPSHLQAFFRKHAVPHDIHYIEHSPSVKLNRRFYDSLGEAESSETETPLEECEVPRGLKILLPSPLYGGSLPIAGYCKKALEEMGHEVLMFDSSFYYPAFKSIKEVTSNEEHQGKLRGLFTMFVAELVLAKAFEWKPDLVFGIAQSPFTTETLTEFRQLNIPTAFWFMEDFRLFTYWKKFAPFYDHFFIIQRGEFIRQLEGMGVKNYHYLPLAADPEVHKPLKLPPEEQVEYGSALSFAGAGYYNRQHFFLQLLEEDFKIWGSEWNPRSALGRLIQRSAERISTEDSVKIFNASKININLHSSSYHNGVNPQGDFVNPRTFEIAACGAFQLVDPRSELGELFDIGREIDTFRDISELRKKMKYYWENPDKASAMAEAARLRVLREHTYKHRMETMLKAVASRDHRIRDKADNPNITRNLLKAAGEDEELKVFFRQFSPDEELSIDKIASHIRKGKGDLTRTEGVFLLIKEFYDWAKEKKVI